MVPFCLYFLPVLLGAGSPDLFAIDEKANIMAEEHFGIINGMLTTGINYNDAASVSGLWSPPYVSSDFLLEVRLAGEKMPTTHYTWHPFEVERVGEAAALSVSTSTTLIYGRRGGLLCVTFNNSSDEPRDVPLEIRVSGTLDRTDTWEFSRPASKTPAPPVLDGKTLLFTQEAQCIALRSDMDSLTWDQAASSWKSHVVLGPKQQLQINVAFAIGEKSEALDSCNNMIANSEQARLDARKEYAARVAGIFDKLPRFSSSNESLMKLYNRSLVHFLTNRWDIPEFLLHPYYGTGSIRGGCVCDYLWNFGEVWEILPLYDPQADREHIKQFLKIDLVKHFAFMPITGEGFGPWYPVNQEKIIGLVYFYVRNTGDVAFLDEQVAGRTVFDWIIENATFGDDATRPVDLIDYGPSNSHLELRRGYPYNHVMPDLNGRRYWNFLMAAELAEAAGKPAGNLRERAETLKRVLKDRLWNADLKWFHFLNEKGEKDTRLTVQIFKLFGSGVLDAEEESGLLSHLNEREFLSEQGLHSMSKTDIAYDQVDIDNGGGGICTSFTPQIAERFYKSGHPAEADDLFRRTLWWGERMPYWGDSMVANSIDYRKDTPLQCMGDGVAVAQGIIFGMFGVQAEFNGDVVFKPHAPAFASKIQLDSLRLRGVRFDVSVDAEGFSVTASGQTAKANSGGTIRWNAKEQRLVAT